MENTIQNRKSCRAFINKNLEKSLIEKVLEIARWAPSGVNHQPVNIAVVANGMKQAIGDRIVQLRMNGIPPNPDYDYYPKEWKEPYKARRKECGLALYKALNISMEEKEKRNEAWNNNYYFFHAPVGLVIYLEKDMAKGSWIDTGMFIQNILLAAHDLGLATCPQAAIAEYPDVIREFLALKNIDVVCGIALGYPEKNNQVNSFKTTREEVSSFTKWFI